MCMKPFMNLFFDFFVIHEYDVNISAVFTIELPRNVKGTKIHNLKLTKENVYKNIYFSNLKPGS